jgi:hypothetical protein
MKTIPMPTTMEMTGMTMGTMVKTGTMVTMAMTNPPVPAR